jgi:hypothetical protein
MKRFGKQTLLHTRLLIMDCRVKPGNDDGEVVPSEARDQVNE